MRSILAPFFDRVLSLGETGVVCDPEETGTTFEENALIKARAVCAATGLPALADDSGLCVDALDGAPGVFSARYAAMHHVDDANALLLEQMKAVPDGERSARFVASVALARPDGSVVIACGQCRGSIARAPKGDGGFGYDPIFALPDGRTIAELSDEEKNRVSHRGEALRALAAKL
ncbi:MAG: RdgB/HAM1 family non-canonical purine NTP pyrophosphatase [Eubacteriales bacterium]|nr:RdgB/HAM1 family non-canonical purine NTP pyrophosphatase [Eubacteriales bacterium]